MNLKEVQSKSHSEKEPNLKGTLISVSVVLFVIVTSWIGVFVLFLSR